MSAEVTKTKLDRHLIIKRFHSSRKRLKAHKVKILGETLQSTNVEVPNRRYQSAQLNKRSRGDCAKCYQLKQWCGYDHDVQAFKKGPQYRRDKNEQLKLAKSRTENARKKMLSGLKHEKKHSLSKLLLQFERKTNHLRNENNRRKESIVRKGGNKSAWIDPKLLIMSIKEQGDGLITKKTVIEYLRVLALNPTVDQINLVFESLHKENSLTLEEFLTFTAACMMHPTYIQPISKEGKWVDNRPEREAIYTFSRNWHSRQQSKQGHL